MQIKLNNDFLDYVPVLPMSWEEFLSFMLRNYIEKKHGIVEILVDGVETTAIMTENPKQLISKDIKLIEITTNDSQTIAKTGFEKILKILDKLNVEATSSADLYREGKIKEASNITVDIINAITPVFYFVNSIEKNFNLDFSELSFSQEESIKAKIEYFSTSFKELIDSQEKADYIELADYLEYQFTDDLEDWKKIINVLIAEIENISKKPN